MDPIAEKVFSKVDSELCLWCFQRVDQAINIWCQKTISALYRNCSRSAQSILKHSEVWCGDLTKWSPTLSPSLSSAMCANLHFYHALPFLEISTLEEAIDDAETKQFIFIHQDFSATFSLSMMAAPLWDQKRVKIESHFSFFLSCVKEEPFVRSPPLLEAVNPASTHNSLQPRCFHTPRCCRFSAGKSMNPLSTGLLGCWICLDDRLATASGLCRTKKSRGWKFASTDAQTRSRGAGGGNKESISTYLYLALHPIWNNRICQLLMLCQRFQKSL